MENHIKKKNSLPNHFVIDPSMKSKTDKHVPNWILGYALNCQFLMGNYFGIGEYEFKKKSSVK